MRPLLGAKDAPDKIAGRGRMTFHRPDVCAGHGGGAARFIVALISSRISVRG